MALPFVFTPEEAQPIAEHVARWLVRSRRVNVVPETTPWAEAPYRTTLATTNAQPAILVEAQGKPNYHRSLSNLAGWVKSKQQYAELYLAVGVDAEIHVRTLEEMKRDGVGLLLVDDIGTVTLAHAAINAALMVNPEPTLKYGDCEAEVEAAVRKFNAVDRKDGLRDMCELVERETERLALLAARKGLLTMSQGAVQSMSWHSRINTLASAGAFVPPAMPLLDDPLKNDFHSFRGARNLVDHPARTVTEKRRRERQFTERMVQGPRLVSELVMIRRRVRRMRRGSAKDGSDRSTVAIS